MAISTTADSATISTTEYFLFGDSTSASYQTADAILYGLLDFSAMLAGDSYRVRVYEKVNGSSARTVLDATLSGVQPGPYEIAMRTMTEGYEVSVIRTAGSDRSIGWSLRSFAIDDLGTLANQSTIASAIAALPSAATIAAAVFASTVETGVSFLQSIKGIFAVTTGKETDATMTDASGVFYAPDGITARITWAIVSGIKTITRNL